ncbi:preprotein translocase subunit SecA, partial [mine drainage metagenome]
MRLFATGAMQWVMERALPEDVPIEAKMVARAIERAQHTVEQRNAETRKEVLKYDEVLNEQRKVIYARRLQVIDNEDLRESTETLLEQTVVSLVQNYCPGNFPEEWDVEGLLTDLSQYYPTRFEPDD